MAATNVSIRFGVDGRAEVKRAFEEIGHAGTQAFEQVDRALEKTGAATERETARFKRLAEAARMAVQADSAQGRFNQVLGVGRQTAGSARASAEVFEQAARDAERYEARARALRATLDPLAAAQDRLNAELGEYAALARRGTITVPEQAAAQALARQRFEQTAQAIRGVGGASRLTRNQLLTLQYTFNDVVASLSTGMSPLTILMQQGGQVTQAFGGLRGTLAAFGASLGGVGGIVAGVAVAVAGLTQRIIDYKPPLEAAARAEEGHAKAARGTVPALDRKAAAISDAARRMRESQDNEIEGLTRRIALQGADTVQRDQVLASLRTEQDLRRRGIDLASGEGRAIIENAGRIERLTQELQAQDAAYRAIETAAGSALDRIADVLSQGKFDWTSWAEAGRAALQDLTREMVKLALLNPLKNLLFGSALPSLGQGGSLFARLFHEGGLVGAGGIGRMVPAAAFLGAPRLHDGAFLRPDEVPAILQRGERVLNRKEARAYEREGPRPSGAVVNVTIQTPNPSAFDASRTQIAAGLARAVRSGMRGM